MSHDLTVSAPQAIFLNDLDTKFRAYVGGFGSGKTYVGCLDQGLFAGAHPKTIQGYFAPTYRDIRDTFWPTMDEAAHSLGFRTKIKSSDKEIELYRGKVYYGTTVCRSMDDPTNIVGFKIARALVDEIDILSKDKAQNAWRKIIARMRLVLPGVVNGIGVTTTPEGFRFVYDTFKREPKSNYSMVQASTYENEEYLPDDYIPSLLEDYPEELIKAYLMGEFVNLTSGTVYRSYNRVGSRSTETIQDGEPLFIGQDFNVNNMASVIYVKRSSGWHAVDEITGGIDTPRVIETIKDKWPEHRITIYPDASGTSRKTVDASKSDIALLKQAGFVVKAKASNPRVKDRVLATNGAFERRDLWVNDKACPTFAEALEQQAYDKNGEPDKTTGHDHINDAGTYMPAYEMPIKKPVLVSGLRTAV
ncbi:MAG: phage terminase large subunit [Pseudomonadota bacterium]